MDGSQDVSKSPGATRSGGRGTSHYAAKILVIEQGHALSLQLHREKDETSYLFSGRLRLTAGTNEQISRHR